MPETLILRAGYGRWLRRIHCVAGLLALAAVLTVRTEPAWTVALLAFLAGVFWTVYRQADTRSTAGRLHLAPEGDALLFAAVGLRQGQLWRCIWASRFICVLELREAESGSRFRCAVCSPLNSTAAYRRLLRQLRHMPAQTAAARAEFS